VAIELAGYRGWKGNLRAPWMACWPIMRTGLWVVLRRKLFWPLLALGLVNFLFAFAVVYIKAQLTAQGMPVGRFFDQIMLTGSGKAYLDFMFAQSLATMLLLAFAGSMLIGADYRQSGLTFYLSRRIGKRHYIAGKIMAIGGVVALITAVPALVLFIEYGIFSNSLSYFFENRRILLGILGYGGIMAITFSLVLAAIASWVPRTVPLVMTWACIFVLLPAVGEGLEQMRDNPLWALIDLPRDLYVIGEKCFGSLEPDNDDVRLAEAALWFVPAVCVVSLLMLMRRVRAVDVVK